MIARLVLALSVYLLMFIKLTLAGELSDDTIKNEFELMREPFCVRVKFKEPPPPENSFWYERNYISVDGSKTCQIHQIAIFWIGDSFTDNRKYTESVLYRYEKGSWTTEFGLDYIPKLRLRNKFSEKVYLVVDKDFGDFQVKQIAYYTGSWKKIWSHPGKFGIHTLWGKCNPMPQCSNEKLAVEKAVKLLGDKNR